MVPDPLLPAYSEFVRRAARDRAAALGWTSRTGESEDARLLRRVLVPALVRLGRDEELGRQAVRLAVDWLDARSAPDSDVIDPLLSAAAGAGGRELFDRLRSELLRATERARRQRLIGALGGVREPALVAEALKLTLDERLDPRESVAILFALGSQRGTRTLAWDFLLEHYTALAARLPQDMFSPLGSLPWIGAGVCTPEGRQQLEAFFSPRLAGMQGGARTLRQAVESAEQCVAQRAAQLDSLSTFLRAGPAGPTAPGRPLP
jgi:cytosol alanyl aminopeptidase